MENREQQPRRIWPKQLKELSTLSDLHRTEFATEQNWQEAREHIERTSRSVIVYHAEQTLSTVNRLLVAVPKHAEKEHDFISCFGQIRRLSSQIGAKVVFFCDEDTREALRVMCRRKGKYLRASYREMGDWEDVLMMAKEARPDDMIVMVSARQATASYNTLFKQIPDMLERFFGGYSYMILYPEQTGAAGTDVLLSEQVHTSGVWGMIGLIKRMIEKIIYKIQTR